MTHDRVRFCPFCREPFEGLDRCPDHDLPLVEFGEFVASSRDRLPALDERLSPSDLRFGRGQIGIGAVLVLVGLGMPAVVDGFREGATTTGFELWQLRADYLLVLPASVVLAVVAVFRRDTRRGLMAVRLAVGIALVTALAALSVAAYHVQTYAAQRTSAGESGEVSPGYGVVVILCGLVMAAHATARLGRPWGEASKRRSP